MIQRYSQEWFSEYQMIHESKEWILVKTPTCPRSSQLTGYQISLALSPSHLNYFY